MDSSEEDIGSPKTYITLEAPKPKPPSEPQPQPPPLAVPPQIQLQTHQARQNVQNNYNDNVALHGKTTYQKEEERITKTMKQRYWHSWEELRLIELWRRYKSEVTDVRKSLPVFRKIVEGMRSFGFLITAQDCRRKINTLINRYNNEKRNMRATKRRSDWNLYPLVDCVMEPDPKWAINDSWHECVIIKSLLDKVQSTHQLTQQQQSNNNLTLGVPSQVRDSIPNVAIPLSAFNMRSSQQKQLPLTDQHYNNNKVLRYGAKTSLLPLHRVTREKIAKLKLDNEHLLQQRDDLIERLQMEERNFKMFRIWMEEQELLLNQLML